MESVSSDNDIGLDTEATTQLKNNENIKISETEAVLYDRQIRLWGVDAQNRLKTCKILIIGAGGLGAEISKNLVLAGVKELTLMDSLVATKENCQAQFLISETDIGKNRAESSFRRLLQLNPMVNVICLNKKVEDQTVEFFCQFNVICLTQSTKNEMLKINNICHQNNIKFLIGSTWGHFGYIFADLQEHEYIFEKTVHSESDITKIQSNPIKEIKKVVNSDLLTYYPLESIFQIDWTVSTFKKKSKKIDSGFYLFQVLMEFEEKYNRKPTNSEEDFNLLKEIKILLFEKLQLNSELLSDNLLRGLNGELSPICAIIGGILSQEIVKAISHKDIPLNNFFFYHVLKGIGVVDCLNPNSE